MQVHILQTRQRSDSCRHRAAQRGASKVYVLHTGRERERDADTFENAPVSLLLPNDNLPHQPRQVAHSRRDTTPQTTSGRLEDHPPGSSGTPHSWADYPSLHSLPSSTRYCSPVRAPTTVGSAPVKNDSDMAVITRVLHVTTLTPDQTSCTHS